MIDTVAVAKQWLTHDSPDESIDAMARVVLAASERVKHGHDANCNRVPVGEHVLEHGPCTCGHDALAAALRPKEDL